MANGLLSSTWTPENFYTAYLTSDCTDTDTDIFLDIVPANSEGTLVIDPDSTTNREVIYYNSKTATKVTCPVNGRGYDNSSAVAHTTGTKVIMAPIADWFTSLKTLFTTTPQGWSDLADVPDSVTYNGNRSYDLVFNSNDLTDTVSNGMRVKLARTVTPPTQCTDLESGSSQYWSKTSPAGTTFTDDFCTGAWIKLESYTLGTIISRFNGTSGWQFIVQADGTLLLGGYNAGSTNYSRVTSYQSIPLNKWVHVAAQLDMSAFTATTTTSYIMIDGVNVPAHVERGGTNPTTLVQAGDLTVGARSGGSVFFDGKIAQAWYSNAKITQDTIKTFISQGMTGSETSIVSHYDFNGDANDNNANANNLTASGGAGYATDSPFNATEYGIITANSFSTNTTLTVQVPEGYAIPTSGGVSSVFYSTQHTPYGFPSQKGKWNVENLGLSRTSVSASSSGTWYHADNTLSVPIGSWNLSYQVTILVTHAGVGSLAVRTTLSTANNSASNPEFTQKMTQVSSSSTENDGYVYSVNPVTTTSQTVYYLNGRPSQNTSTIFFGGASTIDSGTATIIRAELAYV